MLDMAGNQREKSTDIHFLISKFCFPASNSPLSKFDFNYSITENNLLMKNSSK